MNRRFSKSNPENQFDLLGEEEWTPLMAVLIRPGCSEKAPRQGRQHQMLRACKLPL